MKKLFKICFLALSLFAVNAHADTQYEESPFTLDIDFGWEEVSGPYGHYYEYTITSLTDGLIIKKVILNRGHCTVNNVRSVNKDGSSPVLNYSDIWVFNSSTNEQLTRCKPLEIEVQTNQGDYIFD